MQPEKQNNNTQQSYLYVIGSEDKSGGAGVRLKKGEGDE